MILSRIPEFIENRYVLIGPLPEEGAVWITGVRVAFHTFVRQFESQLDARITVINSGKGIRRTDIGRFAWQRVFRTLGLVLVSIPRILLSGTVYLVVSSSWHGFVRDALLLWPAIISRARIVLHIHGGGYGSFYQGLSPIRRLLVRMTINKVDYVVVLGESLRGQFEFLSEPSKIVVVPNGVRYGPRRSNATGEPRSRKLPSQNSSRMHLLYLSNLIVSKGYWDLLEACRILQEDYQLVFECHFAGAFAEVDYRSDSLVCYQESEAREAFDRYLVEHALEDVVTYHGVVKGGAKRRLFQRSHLFILPTYYEREGQPLSLIEAMAWGIPAITTEHAAIPDVVDHGRNGVFVSPRCPREIAEAIMWFNENPKDYDLYSRRALQRYREQFTENIYVRRLTDVVIGSSA